jgi:hypothetical protein
LEGNVLSTHGVALMGVETTQLAKVNNGRVTHYDLAIYIKKYLKAKEELWKFKYFTTQKYNLQKKIM